jgi:hypothetical protein
MNHTTIHHLVKWSITTLTGAALALVLVAATAAVASAAVPDVHVAAGPAPESMVAVSDLPTVVNNATKWLVGILAVLATFFLTLGGARYLAAGGDPSEVERAKGTLRSAGIGYALALLAPVILSVLKSILGVP